MKFLLMAEAIDSISSDFWKNFCLGLIALLVIAALAAGIWASMRKPEPQRLNDDPPIEVRKSAKRFNHDLAETRHADLDRRVTRLENWRDSLLQKLDDDKNEILQAGNDRQNFLEEKQELRHAENVKLINRTFQEIERALGRLEGKNSR